MFCSFCLNILNRHDCYSVSVSLEWNSTIWWWQVTVVRTWIHAQGQLRCSEALCHIQYNLHAFMVVNNYRNKRHFSLWNFLGKGYMPRKMLVSYMYFWGDKYINVINCNLKCHYDQIFTSWFFRWTTKNFVKEWKRRLPFANICVSSGDI